LKSTSRVSTKFWDDFLKTAGLRAIPRRRTIADTGFVSVHNFDAAPSIIRVRLGSEAERAGLTTGDDVLTFNGHAVAADFERRIANCAPETIRLRIRRHALSTRSSGKSARRAG
jgi:predicted metalloprotease with PDZ domain